MGKDQGSEGKESEVSEVSFTPSDFNVPNCIPTCGVWFTGKNGPCITSLTVIDAHSGNVPGDLDQLRARLQKMSQSRSSQPHAL
jgi:hypothetical protein